MLVTSSETNLCQKQVFCKGEKEEIQNKINEVLQNFKKLPVKGFRKNKTPPNDVIYAHYRKQVNTAVKAALVEEAYHSALFENNIKPFGAPTVSSSFFDGVTFECNLLINHKPQVTLTEYKGFELPKIQMPLYEKMYDQVVMKLRSDKGDQRHLPPGEKLQRDDVVIVSYNTTVDGELEPKLCGANTTLKVGYVSYTGWNEGLTGQPFDKPIVFSIVSPEGEFVNKVIEFTVTVHIATRMMPADLDENLYKAYGCDSEEKFDELVAKITQKSLDDTWMANAKQMYSQKLLSLYEFDIPQNMIEQEAAFNAYMRKIDVKSVDDSIKQKLLQDAILTCKLNSIVESIKDAEADAQLSHQELQVLTQQWLASANITSQEVVNKMFASGEMQLIQEKLAMQFALEAMCKTCKFEL